MGALFRIDSIELSTVPPELFWGWNIDRPPAQMSVDAFGLDIEGWALGRNTRVLGVSFTQDGERCPAVSKAWPPGSVTPRELAAVPVGSIRPDVGKAFPDVAGAQNAGFGASLRLQVKEGPTAVKVWAILEDGIRQEAATFNGHFHWRASANDPQSLVSVVIPCYNQAHFLDQSIESALGQTHGSVEVVVIDDGSTDHTAAVAGRYDRVRYLPQENQGLANARNAGLRSTKGDFLIFLDADDRLLPNAAEDGLRYLSAHPAAAFVSGHYNLIGSDGTKLGQSGDQCVDGRHYEALLKTNYIGVPAAVLYRRSVFEHVKGFSPPVGPCADHDLYLRIAREFPVACHHSLVAEYRLHGASMSRSSGEMLGAAAKVFGAQKKYCREDAVLREALAAGRASLRNLYATPLANEVATNLAEGNWRPALKGFRTLLTYDRRSVASIPSRLRHKKA